MVPYGSYILLPMHAGLQSKASQQVWDDLFPKCSSLSGSCLAIQQVPVNGTEIEWLLRVTH
jgi:hypothetical protein